MFLSGVTGYAIRQVCEAKLDGYDLTLYPCECEDRQLLGEVAIMWVKYQPSSELINHIIPLYDCMANKSKCDEQIPVPW